MEEVTDRNGNSYVIAAAVPLNTVTERSIILQLETRLDE